MMTLFEKHEYYHTNNLKAGNVKTKCQMDSKDTT